MKPETDPEKIFKSHKEAFGAWFKEKREFENKQKIMDTFIEENKLPKDITIGELFEFCRRKAEG